MAGTTPLGTTVLFNATTYSDILDVSYSPGSVELIDTTDLSDTTRTKVVGFVDIGTVSVTLNWTASDYDQLVTDADGAAHTCTVTFGNATSSTWSGQGVLDIPGFSVSAGSGVSGTITIQQTAAWTFTEGVGP